MKKLKFLDVEISLPEGLAKSKGIILFMDENLQRIEQKLDLIIAFFHIGQEPRRSIKDLKEQAKRDADKIKRRDYLKMVNTK